MMALQSAESPRSARLADYKARLAERNAERARLQIVEETRYRELLAAESERALRGDPPTVWDGGKIAARMRAPIALADYPQRGPSGSLVLHAEALPQHDGRRPFVSHGVRAVRMICADRSSWLEVAEVGR